MRKKKEAEAGKKIMTILGILALLVLFYFAMNKYEEAFISGENKSSADSNLSSVQAQTGNSPSGGTAISSPPEPSYKNSTEVVIEEATVVPYSLTEEQMILLKQTISICEFVKDMPNGGIIALKFYNFNLAGERVWTDRILIGKNGILESGEPDLTLMMHARYTSMLNGTNLCEVLTEANTNGEMWTESDKSEASLIWKYSGMMKYRSCLGF